MARKNNYKVKEINYKDAKEFILEYHYSGKMSKAIKLNLGIFDGEKLVGVAVFNPPINHNKTTARVVEGSTTADMYELGRFAMADDEPKNSESKAISKCLKWIKKNKPEIKYILSFSDQKEGNYGVIYQATNWLYLGYDTSVSFYKLDGEIVHRISIWHRHKTGAMDFLCEQYNSVSKIKANQHIYLFPLDKDIKILRPTQPYPKKEHFNRDYEEIVYK